MTDVAVRPPRNAANTKERILRAAHEAFAHAGYSRVGLREIAARAGVTSALIVRYFGSKAALFEAALIWTVADRTVFSRDKAGFGRTMAELIRDTSTIDITAMLVLAMTDPDTREVATRVAREHMILPLAEWLGPPDAIVRAMNLFGLLTGFTIQARGLAEPHLIDGCLDWLARALQDIVDASAPPDAGVAPASGLPGPRSA